MQDYIIGKARKAYQLYDQPILFDTVSNLLAQHLH